MRLALAVALVLCAGRECLALELAVIVHSQKEVTEVSAADLREMILMERQHWKGGGRIYLILPPSGSPEKDLLLTRVLNMTEEQLRRHYLGKLYGGDIASFPSVAPSGAAAMRTVSLAPNAIALVDAGGLDTSVKVLRVQGRRPGEAGYLLATAR
jgi:hypothetical protein